MNRTRNQTSLPRFSALPKTYAALCRLHMPRTIHDGIELEAPTEIIDLMAGHKLTRDQEDYLTTLADLVAVYEENHIDQLPSSSLTTSQGGKKAQYRPHPQDSRGPTHRRWIDGLESP